MLNIILDGVFIKKDKKRFNRKLIKTKIDFESYFFNFYFFTEYIRFFIRKGAKIRLFNMFFFLLSIRFSYFSCIDCLDKLYTVLFINEPGTDLCKKEDIELTHLGFDSTDDCYLNITLNEDRLYSLDNDINIIKCNTFSHDNLMYTYDDKFKSKFSLDDFNLFVTFQKTNRRIRKFTKGKVKYLIKIKFLYKRKLVKFLKKIMESNILKKHYNEDIIVSSKDYLIFWLVFNDIKDAGCCNFSFIQYKALYGYINGFKKK